MNVPAGIPVHKATIIPRGRALGMVKFLPEGDRYSMKFIEYTSQLAVAMGGRVAEEIVFGKENITSGASGDIQQATTMARAMVTRLGLLRRTRHRHVRRQPGGGVPGHVDAAARRTFPRRPRRRSTRKCAGWSRRAMRTRARILTENRDELRAAGAGAARVRDADGRGDARPCCAASQIVRKDDDEPRSGPLGSAVPSAGRPRPREEPGPGGGLEPQPQS